MGVLEKFGVKMIGATAEAIDKAEDRALFREAMTKIGLETPRSKLANASDLKKRDREEYQAETRAHRGASPTRRSGSASSPNSSAPGATRRTRSGATAIRTRR